MTDSNADSNGKDNFEEVYNATLNLLEEKPEYLPFLMKILEWEDKYKYLWEWADVKVPPQCLNKMILCGVVNKITKKGRRTANHDAVKAAIADLINDTEGDIKVEATEDFEVPDDLFDVVIGYEDVLDVLRLAIEANRQGQPAHVLLEGVPASGKSVMLMEIERLPGAVFVTAGTTTKAGLRDIIVFRKPRFLLIDEIEKIDDPVDLSVLLTLMESQRITVSKFRTHIDEQVNCTVIAAANDISKLKARSPELIDRFFHLYLDAYTPEQFRQVATNVLIKRWGVSEDNARYVVHKVLDELGETSVRECVSIAKLAKVAQDFKTAVDRLVEVKLRRRKKI